MPTISSLNVKLGLQNEQFLSGLQKARSGLAQFGRAAAGIAGALGAVGVKGALAADGVAKAAQRAQIDVKAFDALNFSARQSDVATDDLSTGLFELQKSLGEAAISGGDTAKAFGQLGIDLKSFGKLKPQQQFGVIADALNRVKDASLRVVLGDKIFKGSYEKLIPLLELGSAGFQKNADFAAKLGLLLERETADGAIASLDAFARLTAVFDNFSKVLAGTLGPELAYFIDNTLEALPGILTAVKTAFVTVGTAIAGVVKIAVNLGQIFTGRLDKIPELIRQFANTRDLTSAAFDRSIAEGLARRQESVQFGVSAGAAAGTVPAAQGGPLGGVVVPTNRARPGTGFFDGATDPQGKLIEQLLREIAENTGRPAAVVSQ